MRWVGHVVHMGEERGVHRVLVGKPEGKRPLGRHRHRWEDNINPLPPNDTYIYIYMSYPTTNLQTLHFKYLFKKYPH
jgi:hypothetical protein